ncbi:serine/threonine-protein kinase pelle-like isoform X2 [Sipha flava]|uniref:non-specific serine/threonine protein kinase n=1 Tax=Sipha flava TaxID=143950 RepID=A0A8B8GKV2_9HEMI|nr:serine/threonine-protein kinase pelle-like isoform X2 [Sipha flava]
MKNSNMKKPITYVYELPYRERKKFCDIMDMNEKWEELGGNYMKFDNATIYKISKAPMRNHSPTDELLTLWGEQNHSIIELFYILYKMQHYQAMAILKEFVDQKYHYVLNQSNNLSFNNFVKCENGSNLQFTQNVGNHIQFNSDGNQRRDINLQHEDLNTLGNANKNIISESSVMLSFAEACTPLITYKELELATNYWSNSCILGKGGFGVVFKGIWKNTAVAVKRIEPRKGADKKFDNLDAQRESLLELQYLSSCRHDNILPLYGFSIGGEKPCLVFQYMINGSLEDRLQCRNGTEPLIWYIRFKIATGTARGLQYLHKMDKPLIHGDIKSGNILLDQYFEPRIGDFGLAREGPLQEYTHVDVTHVYGTKPYLPDEFLRGKKFSTKVDTYSFGVVLFEIATGLRAQDSTRNPKYLKDYVENYNLQISNIADKKAGPDEKKVFEFLMSIGKNCVSYKPKDRPEMEQVFRQLESDMLQKKMLSTSSITTFREIPKEKQSTPSKELYTNDWKYISEEKNELPLVTELLEQSKEN